MPKAAKNAIGIGAILALVVTVIFFTFKYAYGANEKACAAVAAVQDVRGDVMVNEARIEGVQRDIRTAQDDIKTMQAEQRQDNEDIQTKLNTLIQRGND